MRRLTGPPLLSSLYPHVLSVVIFERTPGCRRAVLLLGLCVTSGWACAANVDNVLVRHSLVVLSAHDSAHIRTLVLEPTEGSRIEAGVPPTLERESGGRIVFQARSLTPDSLYFLDAPSARVSLTPPVNGTLRLRACPVNGRCRAVSLEVRTRGRTTRGRS